LHFAITRRPFLSNTNGALLRQGELDLGTVSLSRTSIGSSRPLSDMKR
jgi:hypothetical protein